MSFPKKKSVSELFVEGPAGCGDSVNSFLGSCKRCSGSTERTLVLDEVLQQKAGARSPAHCHDIYGQAVAATPIVVVVFA